jgi:outer membrane protein assembly factor BamB
VANGVVYVGSYDGGIYALNASSGFVTWDYAAGGGVASSPAVASGVVYVGSGDGRVYALDASDGNVRWDYATGGDVASSPAVADGVVFVGSYDGKVYAVNASDGGLVWSYATGEMVLSSPAVANGMVYVGSYNHQLYAFGSSTGEQTYSVVFTTSSLPSGRRWNVTLNAQTQSSTSDSIVFNVSNGVYNFSVTPPTGYEASPDAGQVTVHFADISQEVTFKSTITDEQLLMELAVFTIVILLIFVLLAVIIHKRKSHALMAS